MQHIETVTLDSTQSSIVFDEIPDTFTDLLVVVSSRSTRSSFLDAFLVKINGETTTYTGRVLYGNGSFPTSDPLAEVFTTAASATGNTFGSASIYIPNYRSSSSKSISADFVTENNGTTAYPGIVAALRTETNAVTSLTLDLKFGNFVQHSSASLYGITAGADGTTTVS